MTSAVYMFGMQALASSVASGVCAKRRIVSPSMFSGDKDKLLAEISGYNRTRMPIVAEGPRKRTCSYCNTEYIDNTSECKNCGSNKFK